MPKFRAVSLSRHFNANAKPVARRWDASARERWQHLPRGSQQFWGIPFRLGPKDASKKGLIVLAGAAKEAVIPLGGQATHVCVLHFCDRARFPEAVGERLAEYTLRYADGTEHSQPIRLRFEINPFRVDWGSYPYAAMEAHMPQIPEPKFAAEAWGMYQTGIIGEWVPCATWVYALENPRPEAPLAAIALRASGKMPVAVLGVTLYEGPGHPLRHVPRRVYRLVLPAAGKVKPSELKATLDMGFVTRAYAVPANIGEKWVQDEERGLGTPRAQDKPSRDFLLHATGAEGATLHVKAAKRSYQIPFGEAFAKGKAKSAKGEARLELLQPRTTWLHVTVVDEATGKPTPTRVHFCGSHGEYLPPYGHHEVVNDRWFEDYAGDLQLGGTSYAYVPGRFQIELPVGEAYCEITKGFEYAPLRRRLEIRPGQRELEIRVQRGADWRRQGWVTADTHVHFISPQTAWLEGQAEGLNLINLLASQWGRLFTNAADITGEASGCSRDDTIVWVGTENRHHLLGHISMLGTHGDPVFPMCAGGPFEAYIGDPDVTTLTEWAETCRKREGVVVRPHFPHPICEEPVYFVLGQLDGTELRNYGDPDSGSLDEFCYREWYRYLNCGYRVAAVGGTDKMSAGMPVGGARTYALLDPNDEFTFENWGKAVRAGRTFTTSGPLITLKAEGHDIGDEISLPSTGGTLEVVSEAACQWPIHLLELVVNGQVVAKAADERGANRLTLKAKVPVKKSSWITARCGSRLRVNHCWPIRLGAHTSPVYVVVGGEEMFSPGDATYMLTLIDGGLTYLDTLSVRYQEDRHRQMKAIFDKARRELQGRLHGHSHA